MINHKVPLKLAKYLVQDADVLLFRTHGWMNTVGWWIRKYTRSEYSHAGLAHVRPDGELSCLEFREFKGSREYSIEQYLKEGAVIDVFRAASKVERPYIDDTFPDYPEIKYKTLEFTDQVANNIISTSKELLGRDYGWWNIWQFAKLYMPFIRLGQNINRKNGLATEQEFVCSTLVTYSYRIHYIDPVPYVADSYTSPGDLARSELFCKMFQIV